MRPARPDHAMRITFTGLGSQSWWVCRQDCLPDLFRTVMPKVLGVLSSHEHGWGVYRQPPGDLEEDNMAPSYTWLQVRAYSVCLLLAKDLLQHACCLYAASVMKLASVQVLT